MDIGLIIWGSNNMHF